LGIGVTAYGVLSRGLLSGSQPAGNGDFRAHLPRFTGANYERNRALADALARLASARGATATQLAVAWVLSRGSDIVPVMGARTRAQLNETLAALDLRLAPDDLAAIEQVFAAGAAGTRYDAAHMNILDSER
jgi:aryl-alcohol dehydrogenase-like predicted oxidoreductase